MLFRERVGCEKQTRNGIRATIEFAFRLSGLEPLQLWHRHFLNLPVIFAQRTGDGNCLAERVAERGSVTESIDV